MRHHTIRALALASVFAFPAVIPAFVAQPAQARAAGDSFADLAAQLLPAVVNISSTQKADVRADRGDAGPEVPQFPPGSPFEQFFKDFLDRNRPGQQGRRGPGGPQQGRKVRAATERARSASAPASSLTPPATSSPTTTL